MGETHFTAEEEIPCCKSGLVFESKKYNSKVPELRTMSNESGNNVAVHADAISTFIDGIHGKALSLKPAFETIKRACDRISLGEEIASESFILARNGVNEGSDSNSSCNQFQPNKRQKHDQEPTSARFKGVVLQQNGHWGAQIYANHQRIWLGTFKTEKAAAMAYDSAAIKLRSGDAHRNFPWNSITLQEPNFQGHYTVESVLNMLKDGSYESKFTEFVKTKCLNPTNRNSELGLSMDPVSGGVVHQELFQKELTPSDVGKLNRLVIPKKHAVRYFPAVSENGEEDEDLEDTHLVFLDESLRSWKFRYCYWKSSQSFVFTRGWSRFVKEKELKAKDVVSFHRFQYTDRGGEVFNMIKVDKDGGGAGFVPQNGGFVDEIVQLQLGFDGGLGCGSDGNGQKLCNMGEGGCGSDLVCMGRGRSGLDLEGERLADIRRGGYGSDMEGDKLFSVGIDGCGSDFVVAEEVVVGRNLVQEKKCVKLFGVVIS